MHRKLLLAVSALSILVAPLPASAFSGEEKKEIGTVVREYLIANPEVLLEAMDAYNVKRAKDEASAQKAALASVGGEVTATPPGTALGNPEGDVTVVEFFDYNCGYCKRALPDMEGLIGADPKLRFVLKEIPVLGPQSVEASRVSLAFRHLQPARYGAFHKALLAHKGVADESSAIAVAEEMGVTEADLRKAMALPEVEQALAEDNRIAQTLNITGTPSYAIGDELVSGAIGRAALAEKIENVRRCASTAC